jgi:hypothetical protein
MAYTTVWLPEGGYICGDADLTIGFPDGKVVNVNGTITLSKPKPPVTRYQYWHTAIKLTYEQAVTVLDEHLEAAAADTEHAQICELVFGEKYGCALNIGACRTSELNGDIEWSQGYGLVDGIGEMLAEMYEGRIEILHLDALEPVEGHPGLVSD